MKGVRMRAAAAVAVMGALAFAACSEGDGGPPLRVPSESAEPPANQPNPPAAAVKRTVFHRNPYGNVGATDNLLWDGDFEFRPSFPEQYGWLIGSAFGATFGLPTLGTGPQCRSGIKCAVLGPSASIYGIAVAVEGSELAVSTWVHPDSGSCENIRVALVAADAAISTSGTISAVAEQPDDGWCHFEGVVAEQKGAAYLEIRNNTGVPMVVDDAVVQPVTANVQRARHMRRAKLASGEDEQRWEAVRRSIREVRMPRRAPPTRGEEKLSAHLRGLLR